MTTFSSPITLFPWLYWLLSTSVRERGSLGCHHQPLSLCQLELSHRKSRGIVLVHQRKHWGRDSKPSGKASKSSMRGLPQTSSAMSNQLDGPGPPAGHSHTWYCFRLPSSSRDAAHPLSDERSPCCLHPERMEPIGAVQGSVA